MDLINTVKKTIEKYGMIEKGDKIIVGFSGGPDSTALLYLLKQLSHYYEISLYSAHLNHKIRSDADRDVEHVRGFSNSLDIPFYFRESNVKLIAQSKKISEEAAGREERYRFFHDLKVELNADKIALAHNKNDQAETLLMRFFRGTGLEGIKGIIPFREDGVIRPIIEVSRKDIELFCSRNNLKTLTDSTNKDIKYLRNRIRHSIIPVIEEEINPNIINNMSYMSEMFREDSDYINKYVEKASKKVIEYKDNKVYLHISNILNEHKAIGKRIIRRGVEIFKGNKLDLDYKHIDLIYDLCNKKESGLSLDIPNNICVYKEYNFLVIKSQNNSKVNKYCYRVDSSGIYKFEDLDIIIKVNIFERKNIRYKDNNIYEAYFDYNKVKNNLCLRNRRSGDRFSPKGMKGTKKLKDFFIDEKIPKDKRDNVPLLCEGQNIMWIIGMRKSGKYSIDKNTKKILHIIFWRGANDEFYKGDTNR